MARVQFRSLTKHFKSVVALDDLTLEVEDKEFLVLVGPSGCGKTTALRCLAGLEEPTGGEIFIGERLVNDVSPKDRDIAMVFQNYALYPHMNVFDNMAFGLKLRKVPRPEIQRRVGDAASILGLHDLLGRKPRQLSGGQRQRVAMGRAIIREPKVFLMDEPLSNLDAKLRVQMRADIAALQSRLGVTTVYVTHDQAEAMTLGHRVAVLRDGRLQQCDAPRVLYEQPVNTFVAGFIGSPSMNLCTVPLTNGSVSFGGVEVPVPHALDGGRSELVLGLRPEALELAPDGLPAVVEVVEEVGADAHVFCAAELAGKTEKLVARVETHNAPRRGERVALRPHAEDAHLFDPETGNRLSVERVPAA